jgi:hypothetical protein
MKITKHDKMLLFEQEFVMFILIIILGVLFHVWQRYIMFYLVALLAGFLLYFWMLFEEGIHKSAKKHNYLEHTSSFLMIAQTTLALQLVSALFGWNFISFICMIIAVITYSLSLTRILLFKAVFAGEHRLRQA